MTYVTRNLNGSCIAAYPFEEIAPSEPLYFLVSFKRRFADGLVIFWGPNAAGYTPDIKGAGAYTEAEAAKHEDAETVAVPVEWLHQNCRIRMVIDQGDTHVANGMFWNADNLRAAVPNAKVTRRASARSLLTAVLYGWRLRSTMKAAYADPPYLGCGKSHYGALHAAAADFDDPQEHKRLIERLCDEFECWALSLHEPSLKTMLGFCPDDVRVAAWVKPFAAFKPNVTNAYTWEPVIFRFARKRTREQPTWRDHIAEPIAMMRGFPGAKPDKFCFWVFEGLNLTPDDEFCDLFPGSGAVGRAWEKWKAVHQRPEQFVLEAV